MRNRSCNQIRTPRHGARVGDRVLLGSEPVALVKQGNIKDTISLQEMAEALYGQGAICVVIPPNKEEIGRM